jgi:uncharacterized protein YcbK (DUF882 family)
MKLLKLNDSGAEVRRLQELLVKQGFVLSIDGIFGSKTESAVKALQSKNGITNDGIVGIKTWSILEKNSGTKNDKNVPQKIERPINVPQTQNNNIKTFSLKNDGEMQLTSNFKVREFACKDNSDKILIDTELVKQLQKIRDNFNKPISITSGYRTESYNTKIKGSKNSFHIKGQAFDIKVADTTPKQVAQFCEQLKINGIIQYNTWVHIDSRISRYWATNFSGKITTKTTFS